MTDGDGRIRFTRTTPELERRDRPPEPDDLRILRRAEELLHNESVWNRSDDRACVDDEHAGSRSLFCALHQASLDVAGQYVHRRVALQEVRFAVEETAGGRTFEHRLRDFNNLPDTELADVRRVLQIAHDRIARRLAAPAR